MTPPGGDEQFLTVLRSHGATRLERLRFRQNRRTIWSVTQGGTAFNLHVGYRKAPERVVRALAIIARDAGTGSDAYRTAAETARDWPGIADAVALARRKGRRGRLPLGRGLPIRCVGTPAQQLYVRRMYVHLNATRFDGRLPRELALRFSNRMSSRLGQIVAMGRGPERHVVEIALNVDLLLSPNEHLLQDTLLHEMAHVAAFLGDGDRGHGPAWRAWARKVGCPAERLTDARVVRRRPGTAVNRVPALPFLEQGELDL